MDRIKQLLACWPLGDFLWPPDASDCPGGKHCHCNEDADLLGGPISEAEWTAGKDLHA